jgi:hypothetical protein
VSSSESDVSDYSVSKLAKKLTDVSLFPEGPPDDYSKQFLDAALSLEKDPFF